MAYSKIAPLPSYAVGCVTSGGLPAHKSGPRDLSTMLQKHGRVRRLDIFRSLAASRIRRKRKVCFGSHSGSQHELVCLASYNVHKCVGLDGRFDPARTIAVIKEIGADVIALQEVDQRFGDKAGLLDLQMLQRECGLAPVPIRGTRRSHGWHGNLILIREGAVLTARQLALPGVEPRGALVVDIELASGPLRIIAAHFGLLRRCRARQARAILAASTAEAGRPTVVMGDLNEWRLGQRSSLQALEPNFGPLHAAVASFPARLPFLPLDRILANPQTLVRSIEVHDTPLARIASDHLPVKAAISFCGSFAGNETVVPLAPAA
jgi:endonuclease/exonuclease/phosphatase family metal-dependent hydrolase